MSYSRDGSFSQPAYRRPRRRIRRNRVFLLVLLMLLVTLVIFSARTINALNSFYTDSDWAKELADSRRDGEKPCYLFFGVNSRSGRVFVDHLVLFTFSPGEPVSALYMPGETLIDPEGQNMTMLGETYASGGTKELVNAIRQLTGLPVHYFLEVDYRAVSALVDLLGGISVTEAGAWLGDVSPPENGSELTGPEFYSSFFSALDQQGIEEERLALAGLLNLFKEVPIWKLPSITATLSDYVQTNLTRSQADKLYQDLSQVNYYDQVTLLEIPGSWRQVGEDQYLLVDTGRLSPIVAAMARGEIIPKEVETVEVLNGAGISGLAGRVAAMLEEEGFKIIRVDNADNFDYETSKVIRHWGSNEVAKDIALLIPGSDLVEDLNQEAEASITVILGKNYPD